MAHIAHLFSLNSTTESRDLTTSWKKHYFLNIVGKIEKMLVNSIFFFPRNVFCPDLSNS